MKANEILIFGAGGQAKNVALLIEQIGGWKILGLVDRDDSRRGDKVLGYDILGDARVLEGHKAVNAALAIGHPDTTERVVRHLHSLRMDIHFPNLVHPSSAMYLDPERVIMGRGNIVHGHCLFTADVVMGNFNYFNRYTGLSHDSTVGDYCFIHSGATVSGSAKIGSKVQIGANATLIQNIAVGDNTIVGAGAVVVKDVGPDVVVFGNPAAVLRANK
jgi:sugar O-acyltransferase (sialic acid O-acetyltransferase NeuD family)